MFATLAMFDEENIRLTKYYYRPMPFDDWFVWSVFFPIKNLNFKRNLKVTHTIENVLNYLKNFA